MIKLPWSNNTGKLNSEQIGSEANNFIPGVTNLDYYNVYNSDNQINTELTELNKKTVRFN